MAPVEILIRKLRRHSRLDAGDLAILRRFKCNIRHLSAGEDFIRQGDKPKDSAVVIDGMVGRYQTLGSGRRQYLSVHIAGDWPDAQGLFLERMDHSVCGIGAATVCAIPHIDIIKAFRERPNVGFSIWRETLIDAAIFREAITNNSSRSGVERLAHFFAEIHERCRAVGLVKQGRCALPMTQTQIGELLGMSIATVNRHLQDLRSSGAAEWKAGSLTVKNLTRLNSIGDFDPLYLHQKVQPLR